MYHIKRDGALFCQDRSDLSKRFITDKQNTMSYTQAHKAGDLKGCCVICKKVYFEKVSKSLVIIETE